MIDVSQWSSDDFVPPRSKGKVHSGGSECFCALLVVFAVRGCVGVGVGVGGWVG